MSMRIVVNSTPLIALAKMSKLPILAELFGEVIIPKAVYTEVAGDSKGREGSVEVRGAHWIKLKATVYTQNRGDFTAIRDVFDFKLIVLDASDEK